MRLAALALLVALAGCGGSSGGGPPPEDVLFADDFEQDRGWGIFEEIVGGSACYASGIGLVTRTAGAAREGALGLLIHANAQGTDRSNHVLANLKLFPSGRTGIFRYEVSARIDAGSAGAVETGPEWSLQSTRELAPGVFRTMIGGIQYRANPFLVPSGTWAVWAEQATGTADWVQVLTEPLQPGAWYRLGLEVDLTGNRYLGLSISGGGIERAIDLSAHRIAEEPRFGEEAFWLTLEAENLWNNCGAAASTSARLHYDAIRLVGPAD